MVNNTLKFCDAHVHLNIIHMNESQRNQIEMNCVTNTVSDYLCARRRFENNSTVTISMGYHPLFISETIQSLNNYLSHIYETPYLGEIGLDIKSKIDIYYQKYVLKEIVREAARTRASVLNLHNRGALDSIFEIIDHYKGPIVFHRFKGDMNAVSRLLSHEHWYISINPQLLKSEEWNIIKKVPLNRLLIETDAPYTLPDGVTYSSLYMEELYVMAANKLSIPFGTLFESIIENYHNVYSRK